MATALTAPGASRANRPSARATWRGAERSSSPPNSPPTTSSCASPAATSITCSWDGLTRLIHTGQVPDLRAALLAKHIRFTEAINNIVMLLLGLPFILSRERNVKASAALCLLIVATFFVFIYVCRYMPVDPTIAAWLPILLFGPVSVVMLDSVKT